MSQAQSASGHRPPKKRIPHPADVKAKHGNHKKAFELLVEQYQAGHIDFDILGDPTGLGDATNSVIYVVKRFDVNPSEQAVDAGIL